MTATITVTTADHGYSSDTDYRTSVKAGLAGIGVTSGQIVYDSDLMSSVKSVMVLELMQIII